MLKKKIKGSDALPYVKDAFNSCQYVQHNLFIFNLHKYLNILKLKYKLGLKPTPVKIFSTKLINMIIIQLSTI